VVITCCLDPRNETPRSCEHCDSAPAVEGALCDDCAVRAAVDNNDLPEAFAIAEAHGLSHEYVESVIREAAEYARTIRREMHDAMEAA
jgi:hypothetical protein